jgi:hypothetical protein
VTGDETIEVPPEVKQPVVPTPTSPLLTSLLKSPSPAAPTAQVVVTTLCLVRQACSDIATLKNTEAETGLSICFHAVVRMLASSGRYPVQI